MTRWIFVHGDSDGVVCGALIYAAVGGGRIFFSHPAGLLGDLRSNIEPGDEVYVADIAITARDADALIEFLGGIASRGRLVYVDHHPLPAGISERDVPGVFIHEEGVSASELVYRHLGGGLPVEAERLALFGAIGDYMDETPWVRRALLDWDKRLVYFEAGVLAQGLEGSRRMHDFKRHVVTHLASWRLPSSLSELLVRALIETVNEEELRRWVSANVSTLGPVAYVVNPPGSIPRAATYARASARKPVGIAAELRRSVAVVSLRSVDPGIEVNRVAEEAAGMLGGSGGGHRQAAGARVPASRLDEFISNVARRVERMLARRSS